MQSDSALAAKPKIGKAKRNKRKQSRELFLQAGEELLYELLDTPEMNPMRLLSPTAIADRTGMSKGMLYNLWPILPEDEDAETPDRLARFRDDLARRIYDHQFYATALKRSAAEGIAKGLEVEELIRRLSNEEYARVSSSEGSANQRAALLTELASVATDTNLARRLSRRSAEMLHENADLYSELLEAYEMEMRSSLTVEHLAFMLSAVVEGFGLSATNPPDDFDMNPVEWHRAPGEWTLFAIVVDAIVTATTQPRV